MNHNLSAYQNGERASNDDVANSIDTNPAVVDIYDPKLSMKDIIDMSRQRGYFIDQSQSLNLFMEGATMAKLTSMHFYAWKSGLKTGMYYLRTKSAVDAIKFTLDTKKKEAPKTEVSTDPQVLEKQKQKAVNNAQKFSKETMDAEVEPMSSEEMKALIEQAKASEGDDCLMCGS